MLSLLETVEQLRRGEVVPEQDLRACQNSNNSAERFLAHNALSMISMFAARDHLIDALRAIDHADRQILQTYLDLSKILNQTTGVAQATIRYALAMIQRKQWAPAFEAISQAVRFDLATTGELNHDHTSWTEISFAFELASRTLGRSVNQPPRSGGPVRVALLTSQLLDESATAQLISGWTRHANQDIASLRIYCTDAGAKPIRSEVRLTAPCAPSSQCGERVCDQLKARRVEVWFAPADADAIQTARILTERIVRDQIELLLVDSTLADASIGMAIAGKPAPQIVAIDRGIPVPLSGVDQVIHVNSQSFGEENPIWKTRGIRSRSIFQGVEIDNGSRANRREFGLSEDAIVMMTCHGDSPKPLGISFVKMIARLLAETPQTVYLISSESDMTSVKSVFESAGVAKRVGFASRMRDLASFISMADLYVAEFPNSSRDGVLNAMSAGKPVMILGGDHDQSGNASFVGAPYAVVGSPATLLDRCSSMIRDPQLRQSIGANLKRRVTEKFSLGKTIDEMMRLATEVAAQRPNLISAPPPTMRLKRVA